MPTPNPMLLHFRTVEEFQAYLGNLLPPKWFKKVAVHHTVIPTVKQWRGLATMQSMLNFYQSLHWGSYPHIFAAPDGIWQMNNVLLKGTATNAANDFSIAVEVVGNYDKHVWQEPVYSYAVASIASLQRWNNLNERDIVFHRTYNNTKSCPGNAIHFNWVVDQLQAYNADDLNKVITYRVKFDNSRIRQGPAITYPVAGMLYAGDTFISVAQKEDEGEEVINGKSTWAHVTKAINTKDKVDNLGFVHTSLLEPVG